MNLNEDKELINNVKMNLNEDKELINNVKMNNNNGTFVLAIIYNNLNTNKLRIFDR